MLCRYASINGVFWRNYKKNYVVNLEKTVLHTQIYWSEKFWRTLKILMFLNVMSLAKF